jgi:tRNA (cytidine/uridine-2'-O-)-methyltransferase
MHIILHQPEIPSNTGNIGRTCVATGTSLHLIEPLGFQITEKQLLRAGMDYWNDLDVTRYVNYADFTEKHPGAKVWMATTKAKRSYDEVTFGPDDYIMFGKESAGIPEEILVENEERCIRIPMGNGIRSLNLANSVAIVLYEALRQQGFTGLEREGELHRLQWKEEDMTEEISAEEKATPVCGEGVKIAPSAVVLGNVRLGKQVSIWHNATVRADNETLVIGDESNIQDNCVLHTGRGFPVSLGNRVTVGHGAIVHGCTVEDEVIVGMGAILLNGCKVGTGSIIGAGALVAEGREIPPHGLVLGVPGKVIREVTEKDLESIRKNAAHYVEIAAKEL